MIRYGVSTDMPVSDTSMNRFLNEYAIQYLLAHANEEEDSLSEYWKEHKKLFEDGADGSVHGNIVLGNSNSQRSLIRDAAHRILQIPLKRLARHYTNLSTHESLARKIAKRQGRQFNYDILRHVFTLALIEHHQPDATQSGDALVIGDGYGTMASLLLARSSGHRVFIVNLTKSLALDMIYLRRGFPGIDMALVRNPDQMNSALEEPSVRVIAVQADQRALLNNIPFRLAVNIESMQEMDLQVVTDYFDIIRSNPSDKTSFYCCNRRFKTSNFEEYPWRDGDKILEEGICEWSQQYYSNRPPFMHKRDYGKKVVLHRLVEMENKLC